jgi:hypothetical protein
MSHRSKNRQKYNNFFAMNEYLSFQVGYRRLRKYLHVGEMNRLYLNHILAYT